MNITIKCTNFTLTDAISDYINNKLSSIQKFVDSPDTVCRVEVGKTTSHHKHGDIFRAEIKVVIGGHEFYVSSEKEDLYSAIDEVKETLTNDIVLRKEKRNTFIRRSGATVKNMVKGIFKKK